MGELLLHVEGEEFLRRHSRAERMLEALQSGRPFNAQKVVDDWLGLMREVHMPPLEEGARYRIRCLAGPAAMLPLEFAETETGKAHSIELPYGTSPEFQQLEVRFVGSANSSGSSLLFELHGGRLAMLGPLDLLEVEALDD